MQESVQQLRRQESVKEGRASTDKKKVVVVTEARRFVGVGIYTLPLDLELTLSHSTPAFLAWPYGTPSLRFPNM